MSNLSNHTDADHLTLVLGGTGKTGRRVAQRLAALGRTTRVGSRAGQPPFDWDDPATWAPALDGADAAYVSFYPDLAVPGAAESVGGFATLAADAGLDRLVLLSGRGETEAQRSEDVVRAAFDGATIVRASWFAQNFSESFMLDGVLAGTVVLPVDGVREPFVDADDIADVAVAALTDPGHAGHLYEVTGPRLLTFAEGVAEIAGASGRPIALEPVPMADYAAAMVCQGVPDDVVSLMTYLFTEVLDGRNESLTDGVREALGRPARDFADYARDAAATGVWQGAS